MERIAGPSGNPRGPNRSLALIRVFKTCRQERFRVDLADRAEAHAWRSRAGTTACLTVFPPRSPYRCMLRFIQTEILKWPKRWCAVAGARMLERAPGLAALARAGFAK